MCDAQDNPLVLYRLNLRILRMIWLGTLFLALDRNGFKLRRSAACDWFFSSDYAGLGN